MRKPWRHARCHERCSPHTGTRMSKVSTPHTNLTRSKVGVLRFFRHSHDLLDLHFQASDRQDVALFGQLEGSLYVMIHSALVDLVLLIGWQRHQKIQPVIIYDR